MRRTLLFLTTLLFGAGLSADAQIPRLTGKPAPGDALLADYFRAETARLSAHGLADIKTLDEWKARYERSITVLSVLRKPRMQHSGRTVLHRVAELHDRHAWSR